MTNINNTIDHKNLLQEAFLNRILQQLNFNSGICSYLFILRYHPNNQTKKLTEIARIIKEDHKIHFEEYGINVFAARVIKKILEIFKQEMWQDGIDVNSILNNPKGRNNIYQITYQWLWEKKFPRLGWELAKEVALPAFNKLTMQNINQDFRGVSNGSSKRGLVMNDDVIKSESEQGNYIYLNQPHYLWINLPYNAQYLLLINETLEGNFCLFSPSRAFAYVPYTKLSEGLRLPPSEGLARFFQYDAIGDEYFLAIVTEQPIDLSWINWESDPTDIILNQERLDEIFMKLGQQGNSEVFYKRFKVIEQPMNYSEQSATIINNKNLVYKGE